MLRCWIPLDVGVIAMLCATNTCLQYEVYISNPGYDMPLVQVIDVPGDHFSLLRQDAADMGVLVAALKTALAPHGWTETVHAHRKPYSMTKVAACTGADLMSVLGLKHPDVCTRAVCTCLCVLTARGGAHRCDEAAVSLLTLY